jgi:serine/threonine protein kinase
VLLSLNDGVWKIADFGLTSESLSTRIYVTHYGRGTACYRSPEMIREDPGVSKKSDIWALGCILFELVSGKKAFPQDLSLFTFLHDKRIPAIPKLPIDFRSQCCLEELVRAMFHLDWWRRPSARNILEALSSLSQLRTDVVVLNCTEVRGPLRNFNAESSLAPSVLDAQKSSSGTINITLENVAVILQPKIDNDLWTKVSWLPYWYPLPLTFLNFVAENATLQSIFSNQKLFRIQPFRHLQQVANVFRVTMELRWTGNLH